MIAYSRSALVSLIHLLQSGFIEVSPGCVMVWVELQYPAEQLDGNAEISSTSLHNTCRIMHQRPLFQYSIENKHTHIHTYIVVVYLGLVDCVHITLMYMYTCLYCHTILWMFSE